MTHNPEEFTEVTMGMLCGPPPLLTRKDKLSMVVATIGLGAAVLGVAAFSKSLGDDKQRWR